MKRLYVLSSVNVPYSHTEMCIFVCKGFLNSRSLTTCTACCLDSWGTKEPFSCQFRVWYAVCESRQFPQDPPSSYLHFTLKRIFLFCLFFKEHAFIYLNMSKVCFWRCTFHQSSANCQLDLEWCFYQRHLISLVWYISFLSTLDQRVTLPSTRSCVYNVYTHLTSPTYLHSHSWHWQIEFHCSRTEKMSR